MGKQEQARAKELLLAGYSRQDVRELLVKEFDVNYNVLTIAISRAARNIEESETDAKRKKTNN